MKLFLKYIKPYVYYYILGPIFMLVEVAGEIILPWLLSKIINVGAASHDVGYITRIGLVMVLVAVCMAVGGVLGAWFAANAAMNFGADLRMDLFEKIQKFSFDNIDKFSTGSPTCIFPPIIMLPPNHTTATVVALSASVMTG